MMDIRTETYAKRLSTLIQVRTVSTKDQTDKSVFYAFRDLLRTMFSTLFAVCTYEDFDGSFLLRWKGRKSEDPILLMNHHDVVEAPGSWMHEPFSGDIAEGKLWGRGTLDTKGGLWAMLQAADELAAEGFVPERDVYFLSTCDEEQGGTGAEGISRLLQERGLHFSMVLDEGGMILPEPIGGAKRTFAMVGVGEKGCADLKFIARSDGGHASTPGKDTPLVRLGKFMAAVEKRNLFPAEISPTICAMFSSLSVSIDGPLKVFLRHAKPFTPLLAQIMPKVSNVANAMLRTTVAFTMASGSQGTNVLPQEAWVIGNMRYSHHQGGKRVLRLLPHWRRGLDLKRWSWIPVLILLCRITGARRSSWSSGQLPLCFQTSKLRPML